MSNKQGPGFYRSQNQTLKLDMPKNQYQKLSNSGDNSVFMKKGQ